MSKKKEDYPQLEYDDRGRCIGGLFKVRGNKYEPRIYLPKKLAYKIDTLVYIKFVDRRVQRFKHYKGSDAQIEEPEFGL